ncbi:hypothetical protein QTI33_08520 [Variovorax sp. J22P271]|uniref:hypothetical protein n=1 Tax=Variovorax davisae TaxID=3053515 RepID=UPI0025762B9D|nr:hypothetical protein [Variovorax sp. J22P271]MDM0032178.1 hypothetical protein [Variovorax sp. J22P271]
MKLGEIQALRVAFERATDAHLGAQCRLLARCEAAIEQRGEWPHADEYQSVADLGRTAKDALYAYLDSVHVPRSPSRTPAERKHLIQRLSASERLWQPTPGDWLAAQDDEDALRPD